MAITSSDHKGIVIGHTAKILAERRVDPTKRRPYHNDPMARLRTQVLESCLSAYVQVWVDNRLLFVQCPLDVACIPLYHQRTPSLNEIQEVLRLAIGTYPVGSELEIVRKEGSSHSGKKVETFSVKRDKRALVNIDPNKRNRRHNTPEPLTMPEHPADQVTAQPGAEVPEETSAS